jgi:cytochrome c oxidase subunit 4
MATEEQVHAAVAHEHAHPGPAEYVKVAVVLAIVTAIEVGAYYITALPRPVFSAMLLVMMALKFSLVVLWFMHLRFDSPIFRRFFVGGLILALAIYTIVLLTFGLLVGG